MSINLCAPLTTPMPFVVNIPATQWSGSDSDYYITVSASNITENSILIPHYDEDSADVLKGPIWCVPTDGSFTIHTTAIPDSAVTILIQFAGTNGVAQYQVLADVYSTSQAVAKADIVNNLTSTSTTQPLSAAQGKALADIAYLSTSMIANTALVNTDATVEKMVLRQSNVVAVKFTFTVKGTPAAGSSFFSGLPKAYVSAYQFVAKNTTTKKPIMMAISATDGTLCNWYGNDALAAGDVIRGGATYICQ